MNRRVVIASRLALRAGETSEVYSLLSKNLCMRFPVREGDSVVDAARRKKFLDGRRLRLGGDAYAMLAVAAHETGHSDVAAQAMKEAEDRGAEVSELRQRLGS